MRIAFYIPILNVGGAEKVIINLLNNLVLNKNNSYFLITDKNNSTWISELSPDIIIVQLNSKNNIAKRIFELRYILKFNKFNLLVSHLTHSNIHCLLLKLFYNYKLIIVEHNITSKYIQDLGYIKFLFNHFIKRYFSLANKIICVSNATRNDLIREYGIPEKNSIVIYNPFDFDTISKKAEIILENDIFLNLLGKRYIVTVARLEMQKNHLFLIETIKFYLIENNIKLVFVGGGSYYNKLKDYIYKNKLENFIYLTNYETNPYPYIKNATLLVHPARFEGFGLVLIEALYLGIPVISMNFDVAFEILENSKLGEIVTDSETLLLAIKNFESLPKADKFHIYNKYNLFNIVEQYESLFLNV
jgi:glycosyltransferase involved in cell wall biosynthesis